MNIAGKTTLGVLLALAMGLSGCLVASGTGDETGAEKGKLATTSTESSQTQPNAKNGVTGTTAPGSVGHQDPEPLPWTLPTAPLDPTDPTEPVAPTTTQSRRLHRQPLSHDPRPE